MWTIDNYWNVNHGTTVPSTFNGVTAAQASRYDVYRQEIADTLVGTPSEPTPKDNGSPYQEQSSSPPDNCYTGAPSTLTDDPDRRLISGAVLNCKALTNAGYNLKGHTDNIPVLAFVEFFVVHPMLGTCPGGSCPGNAEDVSDRTLYVEIRRVLQQGQSDAFAYDQVQLYR